MHGIIFFCSVFFFFSYAHCGADAATSQPVTHRDFDVRSGNKSYVAWCNYDFCVHKNILNQWFRQHQRWFSPIILVSVTKSRSTLNPAKTRPLLASDWIRRIGYQQYSKNLNLETKKKTTNTPPSQCPLVLWRQNAYTKRQLSVSQGQMFISSSGSERTQSSNFQPALFSPLKFWLECKTQLSWKMCVFDKRGSKSPVIFDETRGVVNVSFLTLINS